MRTTHWLFGKAMKKVRSFHSHPMQRQDNLSIVSDEENTRLPWRLVERLYCEIDKSYRPRPLDSRGILLRTKTRDGFRNYDHSLGWEGLFTRGLEISSILEDHDAIFRQDISTIAREINAALNRLCLNQDSKVGIDAQEPQQVSPGAQTRADLRLDSGVGSRSGCVPRHFGDSQYRRGKRRQNTA